MGHTGYDPVADLAARWPCWRVSNGDAAERIDSRNKLVLLENPQCPNEVAHTLAHMDLGHHIGGDPITEDQEVAADALAAARINGAGEPDTYWARFDCTHSREWGGVIYCWSRGCGIGG